jgi:hypothetical protein
LGAEAPLESCVTRNADASLGHAPDASAADASVFQPNGGRERRNQFANPQAPGTDGLCMVCEMIERQRIDNGSPRRLPFNVHLLFGSFHANQIVDDAVPVAIAAGCETTPWQ